MSEPTGTQEPEQPKEPEPTPPSASSTDDTKAPWTAEDFDPEKAWNLVQNLRKENSESKAKVKAFEDEKLTAQEKADRDLKEAQEQLAGLQRDKALAEARAKHPVLSDDDMQFLGSGSPKEIEERAAKLAARLEQAQAASQGNQHINPMSRMPLTGGTDPTVQKSKDPLRDMLNNHN